MMNDKDRKIQKVKGRVPLGHFSVLFSAQTLSQAPLSLSAQRLSLPGMVNTSQFYLTESWKHLQQKLS